MFESIVASVLNSALGKFVEGLDADALSISVFKGEVELFDLNLKDSAFDGLGVPVALVAGKVGHIKLYADWKNLSTKAIRIEIDSVLAIIKPVEKFEASSTSEFKRGLLAADEMKWKAAGAGKSDDNDEKAQSLFVQKIIDNIQISLTNVHIRYEDGISAQTSAVHDPARCFALGLTIDRLSITSWSKEKDGTWSDRFVEEPMQMMTKRIQLGDPQGGFAVYCNSGPEPWTQGGGQPIPPGEFTVAMLKLIKAKKFTQVGPVDHVIRPIQLAVVLLRDKSEGKGYNAEDSRAANDGWRVISATQKDAPDTMVRGPFRDGKFRYEPLNDVTIDMEEVSIVLASQTAAKFVTLGSWLSVVSHKQQYEAWKPTTRVGLQRGSSWADTRDWWVFAKKCNDHANKIASVKWDATTILCACEKRRVYLSLYSRKSAHSQGYEWAVPLAESEQEELQSLEDEFDVSVTKTWRRLALKRMNDEARVHAANQPVKRSWFSSSNTGYKELTEQELHFLSSFDVDEGEKQVYPEDWVETKISLTLKNATLTLEKEERELAVVDLAGIIVNAEMRTDGGLTANIGLDSFTVSDLCSAGDNRTSFRQVIERDKSRHHKVQPNSDRTASTAAGAKVDAAVERQRAPPLLECKFEKKPLSHPGVDMRVYVMLQPLQIVFNPYFVEELVAFGKTGEDLAEEAGLTEGLQDSARARALQLKRQTELLKETALTVRTVMDIDVTLSAPTILVPADCSADETDCIMINLGDLKVKSAKGTREHDIFEFGLHDMKAQMFTTNGAHQTGGPPTEIVEPVNMNLELSNSIRPTDPSVPKLKLKGRLEPVRMAISDELMKRLIGLGTTIETKRAGAIEFIRRHTVSRSDDKASPQPKSSSNPLQLESKNTQARTLATKKGHKPKSMRSLLAKAHVKLKEEAKDELSQRLPFWEQVVAEFAVEEVRLAISDQAGSRELAVLKIQGLWTAATIRPYDKHVLLSLKNFQIDDSYRATALKAPCQLLSSSISGAGDSAEPTGDENLLDVDFWDTHPHSPEPWRLTSQVPADCLGRKLKAKFGVLSINLHLGTVSKLVDLSKSIGGASEAPTIETTTTVSDAASEEIVPVAAASPVRATLEASFHAGGLCVVLIPEITRSQPTAVATLQLQHVGADVDIDDVGTIDMRFCLSNIEILRGALDQHRAEGDYVLTVREHSPSIDGDQLATTPTADSVSSTGGTDLLTVTAKLQPESRPDETSVVDASFRGLNIQVTGPFVKSILQWINDNPIGKEDTVKAKEAAAQARQEAAAKARQGAAVAKAKLMKVNVHLDAVTLSIPLVETSDQVEILHCLQFELGGVDVKVRNTLQIVEFRETWAKLKHGTREQQLLKPIAGVLEVADQPGGSSQAKSLKKIALSGLSAFESHISFRDMITLQAIAASMSAVKASDAEQEDPVALAKTLQQERLSKLAGDGAAVETMSAKKSGTQNDASALRAPAAGSGEATKITEDNSGVQDETAATAIVLQLPEEIKLIVKIIDDCTTITKPFLTAQAALDGMKIKSEGEIIDVEGTLVLQLDGFDGSRGQPVPLLERFELDFVAHQGVLPDVLDDPNAKPSLRLAVGAQAVRNDPRRSIYNGILQVQPDGKGEFKTQEVEIHGENLRIGEAEGKIVGMTLGDPKTARAGQPHAFRIDLKQEDSHGRKKYILGAATAQEKSDWIAMLCPGGTRFEVTVTDSYLRDALLTAGQFKELNKRARQSNFSDKTNYGDCVLSNELGVLLYYSRADDSFDSAHVLEPGQTASVSAYLQARVPSEVADSPRQSLKRVTSSSLEQTHNIVKLWFPEQFDPANTKMIEFEASFSQSSAASFGTKTIELDLDKTGTGGANVLTLRSTVLLQNRCDTTFQAKVQNGPPSSPRYTNTSPAITLLLPASGKSVGLPLSINTRSSTIQFRGTQDGAEWSDSVPLEDLIPHKSHSSGSRALRADYKWLRICGKARPIRSYDNDSAHFQSVRREEQITVIIDPAMRFRNNIQQGIELNYKIIDGGGGLGRVAEFKQCRVLGCETRAGSTFFEKDYVVYKFELECTDGTKHVSEKRFSQFDQWYQTLDHEHVKLFMPPLPAKIDSFFKSAEEIQRMRQADLNEFINDAIQAGSRHPPVAQAVRSFMLSHLVVAKADMQAEDGKVRFGACETVELRNLSSLNEPIDLDVAVRINGVDFTSNASEPTTLLSGDGEEGECATAIVLYNSQGTRLRLKIDSVLQPTGAHEFVFNVEFCIVNRTGFPTMYHQADDEGNLLGTVIEPYRPEDVEQWMFGAEMAHQHQHPFSFGNLEGRKQVVICVKDGDAWQRTQSVAIDAGNSVAEITSVDRAKQFGVRISTAPGNASSKMVYLTPRFIVCNHTNCEIDLAQVPHIHQHAFDKTDIAERVQKGSRAIHFPRHTPNPADRLLSFRIRRQGKLSAWCAGFGPQPSEFPVLVRDSEKQPSMIMRVTVAAHRDSTVLIHLQAQWSVDESAASDASKYNYIIRNLSEDWAVGVRQKGQDDKPEMTIAEYNPTNPADNDMPFAWDCAPSAVHPALVAIRCVNASGEEVSLTCNIDELRVVRQSSPRVEVVADGPTKVLRFSDDVAKPIPWHLGSRLGLDLDPRPKLICSNPECRHTTRASAADGLAFLQDPNYNVRCENCGSVMWVNKPPVAGLKEGKDDADMRLKRAGKVSVELALEGFALSVVRTATSKNVYHNTMEELLYISLSKLRVSLNKDVEKSQLEVKLQSFQIDNMMPDVAYPMVVYPEMEPGNDLLSLFLVKMENTAGLQHFKTFQVQLQPLSVNGELALVFRLVEFLGAVVPKTDIIQAQDEARVAEQEQGDLVFQPPAMGIGMLYFEDMVMGPMNFIVSWKGDGVKEEMEKMGIGVDSGAAVASVLHMVGGLGAALTNLKRVPIDLPGLNFTHPFEPVEALTRRVVGHYKFALVYNSCKIFLGTEIFNPIGLLDGVGTGVVNLVTTPFTVQSPEEFAAGTVKNSLKLVQATVGGVFGLIGDTTGAISNVADTLGGGDRAAEKTEKPHGVLDGLGHGAVGVGKGLFNGVTGVFVKPVEGAMDGGALGFVEGVGKGVLGLGGNVVGGVVGGVSDVMSGIAEDIGSIGVAVHRPVRRPRWIAANGAVPPYAASQALGQERLVEIVRNGGQSGKQLAEDSLDRYIECGAGQEIMVTDAHLVSSSQLSATVDVLMLEEIEHIDVEATGDKLVVHRNEKSPIAVTCDDAEEIATQVQAALRYGR